MTHIDPSAGCRIIRNENLVIVLWREPPRTETATAYCEVVAGAAGPMHQAVFVLNVVLGGVTTAPERAVRNELARASEVNPQGRVAHVILARDLSAAVARMVITALDSFRRIALSKPSPNRVFSSVGQACDWLASVSLKSSREWTATELRDACRSEIGRYGQPGN